MKKAVIEMLILKLLSESDMYGYQINMGCISFYEQKTGIRKTRVYYHIEKLAPERLEEMKEEFYHAVEVAVFLLESKEVECIGESELELNGM